MVSLPDRNEQVEQFFILMTSITLVRHGTTEWMEGGLIHGRLDSRLSKKGVQEARKTAQWLVGNSYDAFYTSPQGRARQTAEYIAKAINQSPTELEGLREMDFGGLEGASRVHSSKSIFGRVKFLVRFLWSSLSGETWRLFGRRVAETLEWIVQQNPDGEVLIVTHSGVISSILRKSGEVKTERGLRFLRVDPCSITELEMGVGGHIEVKQLNFSDHLLDSSAGRS
jgi:broad specificity phosphatase PhoE